MSVLEIMTYNVDKRILEIRCYVHRHNRTAEHDLISSRCFILPCCFETTICRSEFLRRRCETNSPESHLEGTEICLFPRDKYGIRAEAERKDLVSIAVRFLVSGARVDMVGSNIQQVDSGLRTCAGMRTHVVREHTHRTDKRRRRRRRSSLVRLCLDLRRVLTLGSCPFVPLMCAVHRGVSVPHTK